MSPALIPGSLVRGRGGGVVGLPVLEGGLLWSSYAAAYHRDMAKSVPVRDFRAHLTELLDDVTDRREHVTITRHGRPEAVLVPADEYVALEETAEILSDPETLSAIRSGLDDLSSGEVVTLEQVRDELRHRRTTQE